MCDVLPDVPLRSGHLSLLKLLLVPISRDMNRRAVAGIAVGLAIVTAGACASSGIRPEPFPTPPAAPGAGEPTPLSVPRGATTDGFTIATAALQLQGIPYRLGGTDVHGFDCSGLVQYVFALYGIALPRVVHDQYRVGHRIRIDDLEPGDLVFFSPAGDDVSHVGIVIGGDRFVHAPNSRGVVRVDSFASGYWGEHIAGARRISGG
jgi:cell wall-associated NlpC family hydrolase